MYPLWNLVSKIIVSGLLRHRFSLGARPIQQETFSDAPKIVSVWTGPGIILSTPLTIVCKTV